jgi:hypothetical protein
MDLAELTPSAPLDVQEILSPVERIMVSPRARRHRPGHRSVPLERRLQHTFATCQCRKLLLELVHRGCRDFSFQD